MSVSTDPASSVSSSASILPAGLTLEDRVAALEDRVATLERSTRVTPFPEDWAKNYNANDARIRAEVAESIEKRCQVMRSG